MDPLFTPKHKLPTSSPDPQIPVERKAGKQKARTHIIVTKVLPSPYDARPEKRGAGECRRRGEGGIKEREVGRSKPRKLLLWWRVSAGSEPPEGRTEVSGDFLPKRYIW